MPDFYYKAKSETKCAPMPKPRSSKKEAKKVTLATKRETSQNGDKSFFRNSAKYATLPAKRTSDIIHLEAEHQSDTEQGGKE